MVGITGRAARSSDRHDDVLAGRSAAAMLDMRNSWNYMAAPTATVRGAEDGSGLVARAQRLAQCAAITRHKVLRRLGAFPPDGGGPSAPSAARSWIDGADEPAQLADGHFTTTQDTVDR